MRSACWILYFVCGMNTNQSSRCFLAWPQRKKKSVYITDLRPQGYSRCSEALWSRRGSKVRCIPFRKGGWWNVHWGWWCPAPAGVSSGGWRRSSVPSPPLAQNPRWRAASRMAACGTDGWDHTEPFARRRKWCSGSFDSSLPPTEIQLACVFDLVPHTLPPSIHHPKSHLWQQTTPKTYDQDHKVTDHSVLMLGSSRLCCESCCTASWWAAFTFCATHTVYCRGSRSILGNDWRQNCCLLSTPSCSGISGDMSTATPA